MLLGRITERAAIDALLQGAREGRGDSLVLTGEPGIGKTTLIKYALEEAAGLRVLKALLAPADRLREAFALALDDTQSPFEQARTQLAYGERLRRDRQRAEARQPLREALETFDRLGAQPWAEKARSELRATGSTVPGATTALPALTPQELQVALVVGRGATNHQAAASLFLSRKTIEYHLSNIYRKTHIRSRADLAGITSGKA